VRLRYARVLRDDDSVQRGGDFIERAPVAMERSV
jgi:hypothetical protein